MVSLRAGFITTLCTEKRLVRDDDLHRVGKFIADYSELTPEEKAAQDPLLESLLAKSTVVSTKDL